MNVAVLGGGVTGLTAAWRLTQAGHSARVLEAGPRLGGPVHSEAKDGWMAEAGPHSLREASAEIAAILRDLGLGGERIESAPAASRRYLAYRGRLVAVPAGPVGLVATPLLTLRSKLRLLREARRRPLERGKDLSFGAFMRDHFGAEAVERVVQPFVSGYCAGDPERLSTRFAFPWAWEAERTWGSLVRARSAGARRRRSAGTEPAPRIISFRRGMGALPDALARTLPASSIQLRSEVRALRAEPGGGWRITWNEPGGARSEGFDRVVAALPARALAALEIGPGGNRPLSGLAAIDHPPVVSLTLGFRRPQIAHPLDGFGALVPATERRSILGIIFASSLFPGRAPDGHVALTVLAGGSLQPEIAALPIGDLTERACADLRLLLGARGAPVFAWHASWPGAIPQYALGFEAHLAAMAQCERQNPGLFIGGSARDGISLTECLLAGTALAARAGLGVKPS
jgi:protoporphyrinogen/coproporphyrinogen III oxidase